VQESIPLFLQDGNVETGTGTCVLRNLNGSLSARPATNETDALILDLQLSESSSQIDVPIAKLDCHRLLSAGRCKLWWMTPEFGSTAADITPETQFLLVEIREGGPYAMILPLISEGRFRGTLRSAPNPSSDADTLWLRMESNSDAVSAASVPSALLVEASWDLYGLVDKAVARAASLSGGSKPLAEKEIPPSVDVFGWCTWDAFYSQVSAKGIREGLQSLRKGGVTPRLLVIDDGWQQTEVDEEQRRMFGDEAEQMEEVIDAERKALQKEATDLATTEGGSAVASATQSLMFMEDEEDAEGRKRRITQSFEEVTRLPKDSNEVQPWFKKVGNFVVARFDNCLGWALGIGEAAFIRFYQRVIDPAPPGSRRVEFWTWLATGPLRMAMLQFYMATGDFTRRLTDVSANAKFATPASGPRSQGVEANLRAVVTSLKEEFDIKYVYCWHGLPGYWGGISPESKTMERFKSQVVAAAVSPGVLEVEPAMAWAPSALAGIGVVQDFQGLYNAMHGYLADQGIDGVKVDCQAGVGLMPSPGGSAANSAEIQYCLEESVKKHFPGNHIINCMCHSSENFYRFLDSAVARACDDFYPLDVASHTTHIANSAFNSVFLGALVQPDWDMFQSEHPANLLHAAARAVSGGAVYVSDKPGRHDFDLLRRLVLPDGCVLRANLPGRPTVDTVFCDVMRDGKTLLKVWNRNNCSGVVGVFNVQGSSWDRDRRKFHTHNKHPPTLATRVRVQDVQPHSAQHPAPHRKFIAYCSNSGRLERVVDDAASGVWVELLAGGCEVVTIAEVTKVSEVEVAPVGLTGMLNPGGAVTSASFRQSKEGPLAEIGFHGCGDFMVAVNAPPTKCTLHQLHHAEPLEVPSFFDADRGTVVVNIPPVSNLKGKLVFHFPSGR